MSKAKKSSKSSNKKTSNKKTSPEHIRRNNRVYELMSNNSQEIELDLAEDVLMRIDKHIQEGKYVSRGDAIRHILRAFIDSKVPIELE